MSLKIITNMVYILTEKSWNAFFWVDKTAPSIAQCFPCNKNKLKKKKRKKEPKKASAWNRTRHREHIKPVAARETFPPLLVDHRITNYSLLSLLSKEKRLRILVCKTNTRFFYKNNFIRTTRARICQKIKNNARTIQAGILNHKCKVYFPYKVLLFSSNATVCWDWLLTRLDDHKLDIFGMF